jgi:BCD family chlorophyll transporter-like MFS transporter
MLLAALAGRRVAGATLGSLRAWMIGGCLASGLALLGLVLGGMLAPHWPLRANVFLLGLANGAFSIAAIGSMMSLAGAGQGGSEGTRMGLWGAAQAIGFALGGLFGAAASDLARAVFGAPAAAYTSVFLLEAALFVVSAWLASRITSQPQDSTSIGNRASGAMQTRSMTEPELAGELSALSTGGTR